MLPGGVAASNQLVGTCNADYSTLRPYIIQFTSRCILARCAFVDPTGSGPNQNRRCSGRIGAMRPSTVISVDGPANLYNAEILTGSDEAVGKGVLVALKTPVRLLSQLGGRF